MPESNTDQERFLPDQTPLALIALGPDMDSERLRTKGSTTVDMGALALEAASSNGVLIFFGEFTCTSSLHLAKYCERFPPPTPFPQPRAHAAAVEMMVQEWRDGVRYNYEQTVAYCEGWLKDKGESTEHVGMYAAHLWLYRFPGVIATNFLAGDEWHPQQSEASDIVM